TVVDWRTPIIDELTAATSHANLPIDASAIAALADEWRLGYGLGTRDIETGALPWQTVDQLHRSILDSLLPTYHLEALTEDQRTHLNLAWHRLTPWPDSVEGLTKLKKHHTIATLSNGNIELLTNMAQHANLPWDHILSAELFRHFKPHPDVYLGAAHHLNLYPNQLLMVATHAGDLRAAARQGLRTAYIPRPLEHGPDRPQPGKSPEDHFDIEVSSLVELAGVLGV
ncbi:MAG: haloacid dehalogenase type II, partial [Dehalococcoidia bacterium]|nr:haloacid dehalogenase type II [Dehalococcoidia bacterium]